MADLSERKREVLFAVVENFISTAEPVGSSQVSKSKGILFSPATTRNVMSELEEMGFLVRPHPSSGGVPTALAYRFYVDRLMQLKPLTQTERDEIRRAVESGASTIHDILRHACKLISGHAHQPGVALAPPAEERSLKHIQFMRLRSDLALAILVTSAGIVENKLLELDKPYSQDQLTRMSNYLNEKLAGMTVSNVRRQILSEMKHAHRSYDELMQKALMLGEQALSDGPRELHIEGQSLLCADPEFANIEKMRHVLRTLEDRTELLRLLDQSIQSQGVKIFIGDEIQSPEINGLSLITSTYSDNEGNRGVLGVIGPTRIQYASIVPLVDFTSKILTEVLGDREK
jgi:heat-inducible transcriptional repressor